MISTYTTIINSVNEFSLATDTMLAGEKNIPILTQLILSKEAEISKFEKITQELSQYLENYRFQSGCQFDNLQNKLQALFILHDKLAQMTSDVELLAGYPDLYGSMNAINLCRELALRCYNKLTFDEIEKASQTIDTNLQKLSFLKQKFEKDGCVLNQMEEAVKKEMPLLTKYKALLLEIKQYIQTFPHLGEDNLAEVTRRIDIAKQMNDLITTIDKDINLIKPFYDRHNKESVISNYTNTLQSIYDKMDSRNWTEYTTRLKNISNQIPNVLFAFEEERDALIRLRTNLKQCKSDIWKNDNEKILYSVDKLLNTNTATVKLDLNSLNQAIIEAQKKKKADIRDMLDKYSWLLNDRYSSFHASLVERYITYANYKSEIESARQERTKRIWKNIGKGVAITVGIVVAIYVIYFLIVVAIAWIIFKVAARSND